jgi:hypothetical protein
MKRVVSIFLVASGSAMLATLVLLLLARAGVGDSMWFLPGSAYALLAGATVVCLGSAALLWDGWQVTFGEVWVVAGSFLLGVASRSGAAEAELLGVCGLLSFGVGYVVLKRASDRKLAQSDVDPRDRESALARMLEDSGSPAHRKKAVNEFIFLRGLSVER